MPRVTSIVWPAFLGVVILVTVSGCRLHVHGQYRHHQHHRHHSTRSNRDVVHQRTHSTSSPKTSVRHEQGTTVEYDLRDDMVLPPYSPPEHAKKKEKKKKKYKKHEKHEKWR